MSTSTAAPCDSCDVLVIGGGFYGATLASRVAGRGSRTVLMEASRSLLSRASFANQARVHAGYHYPRSIMTALRSAVNFERFAAEYREAIDDSFTKLYVIARESKVTASQFVKVCEEIGAPIAPARDEHRHLLSDWLVEEVFEAREYAFDANALARRARRDLEHASVLTLMGAQVQRVEPAPGDRVDVVIANGDRWRAGHVFACVYAQTNTLLHDSGLPLLPLKNELAEICLLRVPTTLERLGITVMDGPFFSVMPFPAMGCHSIHHVRYSPHHYWHDLDGYRNAYAHLATAQPDSNWAYMKADAVRYLPLLAGAKKVETLFEVKTVLMQNEVDDGRPILFRPHHGLRNLSVVLGAKIDNVFDMLHAVERLDVAGG